MTIRSLRGCGDALRISRFIPTLVGCYSSGPLGDTRGDCRGDRRGDIF